MTAEGVEELDHIKKTKKNKHPTSCLSKTKGGSNFNCPFCGSENIVRHGVRWCEICEWERNFLTASTWSWEEEGDDFRGCPNKDRDDHTQPNPRGFYRSNISEISVSVCTDCGAVQTGRCPNCDKNYSRPGRAWRNNIGRIACTKCNFRGKI